MKLRVIVMRNSTLKTRKKRMRRMILKHNLLRYLKKRKRRKKTSWKLKRMPRIE